ncbi:MAG: hypothetical protein HQM13_09400 [SAR324 cluster bacterium]|nr:hypothetical protein [SAR324 cluster bacterium]
MRALRMMTLFFLILITVSGCRQIPDYYTNPYDDPRSQVEYRQWTMEDEEKKDRAEQNKRYSGSWIQPYEEREPIFSGYMEEVKMVNQRLQRRRSKEESAQLKGFQESVGAFSASQRRVAGKNQNTRNKQSKQLTEQEKTDKERYDEYMERLDLQRRLLLLKKRRRRK